MPLYQRQLFQPPVTKRCQNSSVRQAANRQDLLIGATDGLISFTMSDTLPTATPRRAIWPLAATGAVLGVLLAVACVLWVYYGTAVFFEIVRAGIAACF